MAAVTIINGSFESGNTAWTLSSPWTIVNLGGFDGTWEAQFGTSFSGNADIINTAFYPCSPGVSITAQCMVAQGASASGAAGAWINLYFYDEDQVLLDTEEGNHVTSSSGATWKPSTVTTTAPAGTAFVRVGATGFRSGNNDPFWIDTFTWNLETNRTVTVTSPLDDSTYASGAVVPFRVALGGTTPPIVSVEYFRGLTSIGISTSSPEFPLNKSDIPAGTYVITAVGKDADNNTYTSPAIDLIISAAPPDTREFKASNSYAFLVAESFSGLTANMPSTAVVTGVEVLVDYGITALIRSKDLGVDDVTLASPEVAFDVTNDARAEIILLTKDGEDYTTAGTPITGTVVLDRNDFTVSETGTSEGKKWTVMDGAAASITLGDSENLFGLTPIAAADFTTRSLGFRFYPVLGSIPAYADSGDACFRFNMDKLRMRVYFDAGSAEYYFASPDKTQVIRGDLVASYVDSGDLETGDAVGVLQLKPELDVMDGTQTYIASNWTIHAAYPPTDANKIGDVANSDMTYNGLPSYTTVTNNRSRYMFITANFFADQALDSIYGAHGLPRAFAYNGDFFYKIHTQEDATKDSPRHVAYHHNHLALGYPDGRIDISVTGEPFNFAGVDGAVSMSIGDKVNGLLPLSGTILGVFGSKSIWGISGTIVDNFATQVISPNMGAIEYTICDMGQPVYANAYGIYALSQTQQYGDYLGNPMSQDISPWLRPRLVRRYTSNKEVVVAWPVRAKNQYRLAFSDGYVLSMTMNGQQVPTFSFQNYYLHTVSHEGLGSNLTPVAIPDNTPAGVNSTIVASGFPDLTTNLVTVVVDTTHAAGAQLKVTLTSPDGQTVTVVPAGSSELPGGLVIFEVPVVNATVDGTWTLNVADLTAGTTGTLEMWALDADVIF